MWLMTVLGCILFETAEIDFSEKQTEERCESLGFERCDGVDNDCDGEISPEEADRDGDGYVACRIEGEWLGAESIIGGEDCNDADALVFARSTFYLDADGDGFGDVDTTEELCGLQNGFVLDSSDCDDLNANIYPNAPEFCDGINTSCSSSLAEIEQDQDGDLFVPCEINEAEMSWQGAATVVGGGDCDDADASVFPTAEEIPADNFDQNCDDVELCYLDTDADSFGAELRGETTDLSCLSAGFSQNSLDCDDSEAAAFPGAAPEDSTTDCMIDSDLDGYGDSFPLNGSIIPGTDCNDLDALIYPTALESYYDGIDQNCDEWSDFDADHDGQDSSAYSGSDCDDTDATIYLSLALFEPVGDQIDQNCDGVESCYLDQDFDGFGTLLGLTGTSTTLDCSESGFSLSMDDCDDSDDTVYPSAPELCDGLDNNCDLNVSTAEEDADGDGFVVCTIDANGWLGSLNINGGEDCDDGDISIYPNAPELLNDGIDQDCNGADLELLTVADLASGDLIITEVSYYNFQGMDDDWFEVYNASGADIDLQGLEVHTNQGMFAISSNQIVPVNSYVVFVETSAAGTAGNFPFSQVNTITTGLLISDTGDFLSLEFNGASIVDLTVPSYIDLGYGRGVSAILSDISAPQNELAFWCPSQVVGYSFGNDVYIASPGMDNDDCDGDDDGSFHHLDCDDSDALLNREDIDGDGLSSCDGDCDDQNGALQLATDADYDGETDCAGDCDDSNQLLNHSDYDGDGLTSCDGDCDDLDPTIGALDSDGDGWTSCAGDCDDTDPALNLDDSDGDGWTSCAGDCDDFDPQITGQDFDGDGYSVCQGDLDDFDSSIHPNALDIIDDGIDQDCDGFDATGLTASELSAGDIIFSEYMAASNIGIFSSADEWIEIYNASAETIDLFGLFLENEDASPYEITEHINLNSGEYFVFVGSDNPNQNGGIPFDLSYDGLFTINATADYLSLYYDGAGQVEIARYDIPNNNDYIEGVSSIVYDVGDIPNNDPMFWCNSSIQTYRSLDGSSLYYGTPGEPNDSCEEDGDGYYYDDCDDTDPSLNLDDLDGDGWTSCAGDCDDDDPSLNLDDIDGDGISTCAGDCDDNDTGVGVEDVDGDGFSACSQDCDDTDPNINPDAFDLLSDGIDQDCDGVEQVGLTAEELVSGDLIITEIQNFTRDNDEEWIEFYNTTGQNIDLFGLQIINDQNNAYLIATHLLMAPAEYLIAGRTDNPNQNGGLELDIEYGSFALGDQDDLISIFYDDGFTQLEIASLQYTGSDNWRSNRGYSKIVSDVSLIPNNNTSYWCYSSSLYASTRQIWNTGNLYGTPGAPNDSCDGDGDGFFENDCDNTDPNIYVGSAELDDPLACMEDLDGDGYGNIDVTGAVVSGTDCDDTDPALNQEDYDGDGITTCEGDCNDYDPNIGVIDLDNDGFSSCNLDCDDDDPFTHIGAAENDSLFACMRDEDGDGYGENSPAFGVTAGSDCDDSDSARYPGRLEVVDGLDNDCDGVVDEGTNAYDDDGDGYSEDQGDCDDTNANVYSGAAPFDSTTLCMKDSDGDGYGDVYPPLGVAVGTDCNDTDPSINLMGIDIPNDGIDQDCSGADSTTNLEAALQ